LLVKRIITSTADDLGLPVTEQGAGLLDSLRAVRAARAVESAGGTDDVLVEPGQLDLATAPGTDAHGDVKVTNLSSHPKTVKASVRGEGPVLNRERATITLSPLTDPTFIDQLGRTRSFQEKTFTVPRGTANLDANIAWAGPGAIVRLLLLDPNGVYTAYSIPQGFGDFGEVAVPTPVPGTWTAVLFTAASAAGFAGNVEFTAINRGTSSGGSVSPSTLHLGAGESAFVHVSVPASSPVGDTSDALVLSPMETAAANTASSAESTAGPIGTTSAVPIVVRTLVHLENGQATFHGSFSGGNGRGIPGPGSTYAFEVPANSPNLSVGLTVDGNSNEAFYAFLVDPNGEAVSEQTNQRVDSSGNITLLPAVQLNHVNPQAGRWQLVFAVFGPIAGTATSTPFTGRISTAAVAVSASGVPNSASTTLVAGHPVTANLSFTNNGAAQASYFVDSRATTRVDTPLVVLNNPYLFANDILPPFPAFSVPTESDGLTVSSVSSLPTLFEISPFPADHLVDLSFEGDPDVEAGPAGTHPSVTLTDPIVAPQTWLALPGSIGPFGDAGSPAVTNTFTATAHTRPFDTTVTSTSGDPLLGDVNSAAPAATPVSVEVGASGTITVTFTPSGSPGTIVQGLLFLDTFDSVTGSTNEVAVIPYMYKIGK
jgi:hypothetical protein